MDEVPGGGTLSLIYDEIIRYEINARGPGESESHSKREGNCPNGKSKESEGSQLFNVYHIRLNVLYTHYPYNFRLVRNKMKAPSKN